MTDQTVPADKVRAWVTSWETTRPEHRTLEDAEGIIQALRDMLPTPPTLADMTEEERRACQWMQAKTWYEVGIIVWVDEDTKIAHLITRVNGVLERKFKEVTPRPDLPRLEWPSDKKPSPTLPDDWRVADHKDNGRVIVTNTTPNRDGYVCCVLPAEDYARGYDWLLCKPYELTYLDTDQ